MTESWRRARGRAAETVRILAELLSDEESSDQRLIAGYVDAKRQLARAFEVLARERYADSLGLSSVIRAIENVMLERYGSFPAKYLRVRGFGEVHRLILAFLRERVEAEVAGDELRLLTGDAVHTERRARELRDLGFDLDAYRSAGANVYVLRDGQPDLVVGAHLQVKKNIREDKRLSAPEQGVLLVDLDRLAP